MIIRLDIYQHKKLLMIDRVFHAIFKAWPTNPVSIIPVLFITSSCAAMAARIFFQLKWTAQNSIYFFRKA